MWLLFHIQKTAVPHTAKGYIPLRVVATITGEIKSSTISWFKIFPEHWEVLWTWISDPTWLCKKKLLKFRKCLRWRVFMMEPSDCFVHCWLVLIWKISLVAPCNVRLTVDYVFTQKTGLWTSAEVPIGLNFLLNFTLQTLLNFHTLYGESYSYPLKFSICFSVLFPPCRVLSL